MSTRRRGHEGVYQGTTTVAFGLALAALSACGGDPPSSTTSANVAGSGTIAGSIAGRAVDRVAAAYFIGQSDDPARTTVIYVLDAAVPCGALASPGWDGRIADQTAALEMKLVGPAPASYPVSTSASPAQGEASVNFTRTSTTATPGEESSSGGTVTLEGLSAASQATGSFDLTFPDGALKGTFLAAWCADGHEP